jgi:hypothetical protein
VEEIDVTARFLPDGTIIPTRFDWQDTTYNVHSIGRSWSDDNGYHVMVMGMRSKIFHLYLNFERQAWYVIRFENNDTSFA